MSFATTLRWMVTTLKAWPALTTFGPGGFLLGERTASNPMQDEIRVFPYLEEDVANSRTFSGHTRKPLISGGTSNGETLTCKWGITVEIYIREPRTEARLLGSPGKLGELDSLAHVKSAIENAWEKNKLIQAVEFGAATFVRDPDPPRVVLQVTIEEVVLALNRIENLKEVS